LISAGISTWVFTFDEQLTNISAAKTKRVTKFLFRYLIVYSFPYLIKISEDLSQPAHSGPLFSDLRIVKETAFIK
jgi:hypothetical protein